MFNAGSKHPLDIDCRAAQERLRHGAKMIDVREAHEVAHGMVPGSVHIPLGTLAGDIAATLARHGIDPAASDVLCICASGGRSRHAAMALRHAGCETAASVMGGVMAWGTTVGALTRR